MASKPRHSIFGLDDSIPLVGTEDIFGYKQNNPQATRDSNPFGYTPEELESFRRDKSLEEKAAGNILEKPKRIDFGDYLKLEDIKCVDASGDVFESYPELYVGKNFYHDQFFKQISLTPYRAIEHYEHYGMFLPSFALTCNILAELYKNKSDSEIKAVLMQYQNKGNGNGWHAQNTIINWRTKRIIHYPHDSDFPTDGGTGNINQSDKRTALKFLDNGLIENKDLKDALKIKNYADYVKNITGLEDPSILVEIANHFGKTAQFWISSRFEVKACWLGCYGTGFNFSFDNSLGCSDALRGVSKKIP